MCSRASTERRPSGSSLATTTSSRCSPTTRRFVLDPKLALTAAELEAHVAELAPDERANENLLAKDGEDHRRLRRLVTKAFTPRIVEQLRTRIQEIADDLIDRVEERGSMELVDDFAFPLPITVIAELLGIPVGDRQRFREWSSNVVMPALTPEDRELARRRSDEFIEYLDDLFAERRARPTDDLVSALVQAEDGGDTLSANELSSMVVLLIVAGHETTVSLLTAAMHTLLTYPEQLAALRADRSLMASAVEELLRFDSPVERTITRWVAADTELGGQTLRRGDLVIAVVGSANRDSRQFPNADTLDLTRADNKHVGFGRGPHYCLGAPLARLETEIALETLLRRLPGLRLEIAEEDLYWRPIPLFRSLAELPVAWDV